MPRRSSKNEGSASRTQRRPEVLISSLLDLLEQAYRKKAWHGPNHLPLIQGVAAHDVYHTGQIQLLKRLASQP